MKYSFVMGYPFLSTALAKANFNYFVVPVYPIIVRPSFDRSFREFKYLCTSFLIKKAAWNTGEKLNWEEFVSYLSAKLLRFNS